MDLLLLETIREQPFKMPCLRCRVALHCQGLHVPDAFSILIDTPITGKETHTCHRGDSLCRPLLCILVALVDKLLRLDVRRKVIRD